MRKLAQDSVVLAVVPQERALANIAWVSGGVTIQLHASVNPASARVVVEQQVSGRVISPILGQHSRGVVTGSRQPIPCRDKGSRALQTAGSVALVAIGDRPDLPGGQALA